MSDNLIGQMVANERDFKPMNEAFNLSGLGRFY
jgi:hypothetical protein